MCASGYSKLLNVFYADYELRPFAAEQEGAQRFDNHQRTKGRKIDWYPKTLFLRKFLKFLPKVMTTEAGHSKRGFHE